LTRQKRFDVIPHTMAEFIAGIRGKDGDIENLEIKGESFRFIDEGGSHYLSIEGKGPGNQVWISRDALVFIGPSEMLK
jgi:hypothetical protein